VGADEIMVECVPFAQVVADGLEQGEIAAHADGQVQVGQGRAPADDAVHLLRVLEPHQSGLGQRVDAEDLRAVTLRLFQRDEHARVVGPRVLPDDHDQPCPVDVVERHRSLAHARSSV
jgi:hypothetical protein